MNGITSLMTPTGVPFRTGTRGESTAEQRYFVPGYATAAPAPAVPLTPEQQANLAMAAQRGNYGDGPAGDPNPNWTSLPPEDRAAYYAENPTMSSLSKTALDIYGMTTLGTIHNLVDPVGLASMHNTVQGINPTLSSPVAGSVPGTQQVTSIPADPVQIDFGPQNQISNFTQMNQQQAQQNQPSPATVATNIAATIADIADAEAGATNAAAAAAANQASAPQGTTGGGGGDTGAAPSEGGGFTAASQNVDNMMGADPSTSSGPSDPDGNNNFNKGGLASLANRVQERGRGQDTMLVHMTPKEVGGLQALAMAHGGSLTINPQTGLPEAGFLSSILPMVAGAALTIGSGGAINPYMSAAIVGGFTGLSSKSLSKGLMAGLGAFGGAGLGTALSAAGAAGATAPALTGTAPGLAQAGVVAPQAAMSAAPSSFQAALPGLGVSTAGSAAAPAAATTFAPAAAPVTFGNMASGIPALGTEAGRNAALQSLGGGMGAIKTVGMAAAPLLAGGFDEPSGLPVQEQFIRPFKYEARPSTEEDANFRYRTGKEGESTGEQRYFSPRFTPLGVYKAGSYAMGGDIEEKLKDGGMSSFDDEYGQDEYAGGGLTAFKAGGLQDGGFVVPADVVAHLGNGSTDAGLRLLAKTLKAKPIKGDGDGMSDSIPTTIGGKQPARVADGEAYISPEVTKKVGSERLYKMMERIRKAKTGKERQAPEINTREYVPA